MIQNESPIDHETQPPISKVHNVEFDRSQTSASDQLTRAISSPGILHKLETHLQSLGQLKSPEDSSSVPTSSQQPDENLNILLNALGHHIWPPNANDLDHDQINIRPAVCFTDLTVKGNPSNPDDFVPSIYLLAKSIILFPFTIKNAFFTKKNNPTILSNIDGIVYPGEMLLVLGSNDSGCSTLLKTLSGQTSDFSSIEGSINYDSMSLSQLQKSPFRSQIIYNSAFDAHFPHITVRQTLNFAVETRLSPKKSSTSYRNNIVSILSTQSGLNDVLDSKVGNQFIPGISPDLRQRLTIAEAMACRGSVYCWDDAPRAIEFTVAIRASTNLLSNVSISAMHQANERVYKLYNKVLLLCGGREIYFGRTDLAREYFERMGYKPIPTESTDDFLARIGSQDPLCQASPEKESVEDSASHSFSPLELETKWKSSPEYHQLIHEIANYRGKFDSTTTPIIDTPLYRRSYLSQLRIAIKRGYYRTIGDKAYVIITMILAIVHALVIGPLFFNLNPTTVDAFSKGGGLFFALIYNITVALIEVPIAIVNRPIFLKQRRYYFVRPSIEYIQQIFTNLPMRSIAILLFALTYYFLSGFRKAAGHFFLYLFTVELTTYSFVSYYQMTASVVRIPEIASTIAGLSLFFFLSYSGYMIPTTLMRPWFRWLNRIDPMAYGFEILLANEFHNRELQCGLIAPSGPGYQNIGPPHQSCVLPGASPDQIVVMGDSYMAVLFGYKWSHVWRNVGIVVALWLSFAGIAAIGAEMFSHAPRMLQKRLRFARPNTTFIFSSPTSNTSDNTVGQKTHIAFTWRDVSHDNLNHISGYVKSGQMLAIIGENNSPISTLLHLLALRIPSTSPKSILLNGNDPVFSSNSIGFVKSLDDHVPYQTVREALLFSARLRLSSLIKDSVKKALVDKIVRDLDLYDIADAWIGPPGHVDALSSYQRKKLSIGVELAAMPSVLIIDDASNIFDTVECHKMTNTLRSLSTETGMAIICSISEPTSYQLEHFDNVLLLSNSGRTCYFGKIGTNLNEIISYFDNIHCSSLLGEDRINATDFLLQSVRSLGNCTTDRASVWENSSEKAALDSTISQLNQESLPVIPILESDLSNPYFTNLRLVYCRTLIAYWRSPRYFFFKALFFALAGLFVGFSFYKPGNSLAGLQNAVFAIFFSVILGVPLSAMIHDQVIPIRNHFEAGEKYYRKTYHWSCLIISVLACELKIHIILSTLFYVGLYFPVHFISTPAYFYFVYCILFQIFLVTMTLGISFLAPDIMAANNISSAAFAFTGTFCGVPQRPVLMTGLYEALYRVSPYTYFIQSYAISLFHNEPVVCKPHEYTIFDPLPGTTCQEYAGNFVAANGGYLQNPNANDVCAYCQFASGDQFLDVNLSTSYHVKWRNVGIIFAYVLFNLICIPLGYYIFRVRKWPSLLLGVRNLGRKFVFAKNVPSN